MLSPWSAKQEQSPDVFEELGEKEEEEEEEEKKKSVCSWVVVQSKAAMVCLGWNNDWIQHPGQKQA